MAARGFCPALGPDGIRRELAADKSHGGPWFLSGAVNNNIHGTHEFVKLCFGQKLWDPIDFVH